MGEVELCRKSAREMAAMIKSREISAVELLEAHFEQINRYNPSVNAFVTIVEDRARAAAKEADAKTVSDVPLGILHGLPMAHKDTHRTKGIRTTFGSPLLVDNVPEADDLIIERLRLAGAITIGKTNTPEFAAGSHTYNPVFGATHNPYDLARSAGGSSGGAAVGVALGMHPLADGSDMGGSLRNPASFSGVVGMRPSFGRVPSFPSGVSDERLSVPGPIARTVDDVALMLEAIAGEDARVRYSLSLPSDYFVDATALDNRRRRVAWSPDLGGLFPIDREVRNALARAPVVFEELGWEVTEELPDLAGADEVFRTLRAHQFAEAFSSIVATHSEMVKESIRWNVEIGLALTRAQIQRAKAEQRAIASRMRDYFSRVDLFALTVSQVAPFPIELEYPSVVDGREMGDYLEWMASCYLISATRLPAIALPFGFTAAGLPIGLQLVGPPDGDLALLQASTQFERATIASRRFPPLLGA
ncbi:MAG TPA: amidase family protein [Acidimicrobiales bacterium]|nr:amidase family protein [Acidimicrobiales bacterium]